MTFGLRAALRSWSDLFAVTQASMALAASRTPQQSQERRAALADALRRSALSMTELGDVGAQVAWRGLGPIHAEATADAKRLAAG